MKQDTRITQEEIDSAEVRLKPVLGVAPGVYLAAIYGLAALAILFAILLLPGIRHFGRQVEFVVDPPGSAVYIDGVYRGYSPCRVFVAAGDRSVEITNPGFKSESFSYRSKGRAFATLIFPPKDTLSVSLESPAPDTALAEGVARYASWAMAGNPSDAYQIPMSLSEAAVAVAGAARPEDAVGLAGAGLSYARHSQSLRDLSRAVAVAYGGSPALTPATMGRVSGLLAAELAKDPAMLLQLASLSPKQARDAIEASALYGRARTLGSSSAPPASATSSPSAVGGVEMVAFGHGTASIGASGRSAKLAVAPYRLAVAEVTVAEFRLFIEANPAWATGARDALVAAGKVEPDYLEGIDEASPSEPVRYVSWEAAQAYCRWLSSRAPTGYRFALPSEAQWSYAASASGDPVNAQSKGPLPVTVLPRDAAGLQGMLGNVWEWCDDSYAVDPACGEAGRKRFPSADKVVRGGSWANRPDLVNLGSRGPMTATTCSPYLGFRVALVHED